MKQLYIILLLIANITFIYATAQPPRFNNEAADIIKKKAQEKAEQNPPHADSQHEDSHDIDTPPSHQSTHDDYAPANHIRRVVQEPDHHSQNNPYYTPNVAKHIGFKYRSHGTTRTKNSKVTNTSKVHDEFKSEEPH